MLKTNRGFATHGQGTEEDWRSPEGQPQQAQDRVRAAAETVALIGEAIPPDAFAGDAHAFLVAVYKNPRIDHHTRQDAAKAALPYEKPRLQAVTLADEGGEPLKMRSELETGRRLAFVLELIARGEVKAKLPKDAPLLDGLEVPERDLAGREFATSEPASLVPSGRPPQRKKQ